MSYGGGPRSFAELLSYHWSLGRWFGIHVRLHWMTVLMPLLLMSFGFTIGQALVWLAMLYLVVFAHELGHIFAGRRFRISADEISLSPLGGLAHMQQPAATPGQDILISAAGPATHLVWLALTAGAQAAFGTGFLRAGSLPLDVVFFQLNLWLMIFNLLPFFPLDGGRILGGLLCFKLEHQRAHLLMARIGIAGAVLFIIAAFSRQGYWSSILLVIGISNLITCFQYQSAVKHMGGGVFVRREPWEMDSESWKRGADPFGETESRPGFFARRRAERDRRAHNRRMAEAEALERELDRILDKVHREGLPSLTRAERKVLEMASERRRSGR